MRTPEEIFNTLKTTRDQYGKLSMEFVKTIAEVSEEEAAVISTLSEDRKNEFRELIGHPKKSISDSNPTPTDNSK
jgi:hypothetical protein